MESKNGRLAGRYKKDAFTCRISGRDRGSPNTLLSTALLKYEVPFFGPVFFFFSETMKYGYPSDAIDLIDLVWLQQKKMAIQVVLPNLFWLKQWNFTLLSMRFW